jgi:Fe-S-cluster-containing hydrogenase component 2
MWREEEISEASKAEEREFVIADFDKCSGCGVCELICALHKEDKFDPKLSRIKVLRLYQLINTPVACRFCEDAPCVASCPRDALKQSEETGVILVDDDKCDLCSWCIEACPYGAITVLQKEKTVRICDLCEGQPQCIEWCPEEALDLSTQQEFDEKIRKATVKKLLPETWR